MATVIRPELSTRNKYYINKHRHYELKHFCLQYPIWKKEYEMLDEMGMSLSIIDRFPSSNMPNDPTSKRAIMKAYYNDKIRLIEEIAIKTDKCLSCYILKAVTEERSYTYLKARLGIPCSRDVYYDRYRKFFWLLNKARL